MHPNAQVVLRGFQAFAEGDMATMKSLFHDDAVWHTAGNHRFAGDHQGADAILRNFQDVSAAAQIENKPHDVLASDDHVVVLVNSSLRSGDKTAEVPVIMVFHVEDGRVAEAWGVPVDVEAANAFWGD